MLVQIGWDVVMKSGEKVHLGSHINQNGSSYQKNFQKYQELSHRRLDERVAGRDSIFCSATWRDKFNTGVQITQLANYAITKSSYLPCSSRNFSTSIAAAQPDPAAVIA